MKLPDTANGRLVQKPSHRPDSASKQCPQDALALRGKQKEGLPSESDEKAPQTRRFSQTVELGDRPDSWTASLG
jgi:hypothetical protein